MIEANYKLSNHAATRMAQRGIRSMALGLLLQHGSETSAGGDRMRSRLLDRTARELLRSGADPEMVVAATKLEAVVSADGSIVTCYHVVAKRRSKVAKLDPSTARRRSRQAQGGVDAYRH